MNLIPLALSMSQHNNRVLGHFGGYEPRTGQSQSEINQILIYITFLDLWLIGAKIRLLI